jgi:hypothetical protein
MSLKFFQRRWERSHGLRWRRRQSIQNGNPYFVKAMACTPVDLSTRYHAKAILAGKCGNSHDVQCCFIDQKRVLYVHFIMINSSFHHFWAKILSRQKMWPSKATEYVHHSGTWDGLWWAVFSLQFSAISASTWHKTKLVIMSFCQKRIREAYFAYLANLLTLGPAKSFSLRPSKTI